jgi:hypothetical protein
MENLAKEFIKNLRAVADGAMAAEGPTTRRRFFLAAGSVATVLATVKSASARIAEPDSQLLEIARLLEQLQPAYAAASREESRLIEIYYANRPERPPEMEVRHLDALGVDFDYQRLPNGNWLRRYSSPGVAELRASPRVQQEFIATAAQWATKPTDVSLYVWAPDPRGQARAEEVISACDAWEAECEAYKQLIGLTEAQRIATEFSDRDDALYDALLAIPAKTLTGLAAQAAAVRFRGDDNDEAKIVDGVFRLTRETAS